MWETSTLTSKIKHQHKNVFMSKFSKIFLLLKVKIYYHTYKDYPIMIVFVFRFFQNI